MRCAKWVAGVAWICVSAATPTMVGEVVWVDLELTPPDPMNVLEITLTANSFNGGIAGLSLWRRRLALGEPRGLSPRQRGTGINPVAR